MFHTTHRAVESIPLLNRPGTAKSRLERACGTDQLSVEDFSRKSPKTVYVYCIQVVPHFEPPDALGQLHDWWIENAEALAGLPPGATLITVGPVSGGDLATVSVDDAYADHFVKPFR
jgi:hypothetical protein